MSETLNNTSIGDVASLHACARNIVDDIARPYADDVDRAGRFPSETIDALKASGLLGAAVPRELGGGGLDIADLAHICTALGSGCASSGMIVAMHYIQVACLANHCRDSVEFSRYLEDVASDQRLIASVTSEVGTDGDLLRSIGAIEATDGNRHRFTKHATTVSYAYEAADLLATMRRSDQAKESDQVLVLALAGDFSFEQTNAWDAPGMRGTCSPGAVVTATVDGWQIVETPFQQIAAHSMIPLSRILWSAVWVGIAQDAVATARRLVQKKARQNPSVVPRGAGQLAALGEKLQLMRADLDSLVEQYASLLREEEGVGAFNLGFSLRLNNLKLSASRLVYEIVTEALLLCGISAYHNNSESSLGRHLRDAMSAPLMVNNNRILDANAALQMVYKENC